MLHNTVNEISCIETKLAAMNIDFFRLTTSKTKVVRGSVSMCGIGRTARAGTWSRRSTSHYSTHPARGSTLFRCIFCCRGGGGGGGSLHFCIFLLEMVFSMIFAQLSVRLCAAAMNIALQYTPSEGFDTFQGFFFAVGGGGGSLEIVFIR